MTDHLPECKALDVMPEATTMFYSTSRQWFWEHGCICDRLHACEQRVLDEHSEPDAYRGWVVGYAAGLDAAREAVAEVQDSPKLHPYWIDREAALASIDALRES